MARSNFGKKVTRATSVDDARTTNLAGGKAWSMTLEERFTQLSYNGIIARQFYCSEHEIIKRGNETIIDFVSKNSKRAMEIAIDGRENGFIRSTNIMALARASSVDPASFKTAFNRIIQTPRDLVQFLDYTRTFRGYGRLVKYAIMDWLEANLSEFYATKYRSQLKDAIRITHHNPSDSTKKKLEDYIMGRYDHDDESFARFPMITAMESLKRIDDPAVHDEEISRIIRDARLDWNAIKGIMKPTPEMWKSFATTMSTIALVQNLGTIARNAGEEFAIQMVRTRIDPPSLHDGKVSPFQLAKAYVSVPFPGLKRSIGDVIDQYASRWSYPKLGRVAVCPDVSGSMCNEIDNTRKITDKRGRNVSINTGKHVPIHLAGMLAGVLCSAIPDSHLIAWDTRPHLPEEIFSANGMRSHYDISYDIDDLIVDATNDDAGNDGVSWRKPTTIMEAISRANGGGTSMEVPIKYLLDKDIEIDTFIAITDSEEWGSGWLDCWRKYRELHDARAFLIRVDLYPTRPFPARVAEELDITQIFGFSDHVFKILDVE